jgi:hypothetical protein
MPVREEEKIARDLFDQLESAFGEFEVDLELDGAVNQWHVSATRNSRSMCIHCFHYGDMGDVLVLGLRGNAHLSKVQVGSKPTPHSGAEYLANFQAGDIKCGSGRTPDSEAIITSVADWLIDEVDREGLYARHAFVDRKLRALRDIADRVHAHLPAWIHATLDADELWIYGGDRSCRLASGEDNAICCAFLDRRTQLICGETNDESLMARAIRAWTAKAATLGQIGLLLPESTMEPFADLFERGEYSSWHWNNVLQQAEHDDVLGFYRPLLDLIVKSEVVSKFFSFTSLNRLCISRSSLFPFDTSGLPVLCPSRDEQRPYFLLNSDRPEIQGNAAEMIGHLEQQLSRETTSPYFGIVDERLIEPFNQQIEKLGSPCRARRVQRGQWLDVIVRAPGGRRCALESVVCDISRERFERDWSEIGEELSTVIEEAAKRVVSLFEQGFGSGDDLVANGSPEPRICEDS